MTDRARPTDVPEGAEWNANENEWELGAKNADGKPIGDWTWWDPEGRLVCQASYDDRGELHGLLERWHPNGERAQWAPWVHGKAHGVQAWTLATDGNSDKHSRLPPNVPSETIRMDMPYYHGEAQSYHFTFYRESGRDLVLPVDERGFVENITRYLEHVLPETTLLRIGEGTAVNGAALSEGASDDTRWVFDGPSGDDWRIKQWDGSSATPHMWVVDTETFERCFALSTPAFLHWIETRRPATVPDGAKYVRQRRRWWHGLSNGRMRVGEWTCWDEQGRVRGFETWSPQSVLHGPVREVAADGTIVVEGQYVEGFESGVWHYRRTDDPDHHFPIDHEDVVRAQIRRDPVGTKLLTKCFLEDGTPCTQQAVPLVEAYADDVFTNAEVVGWFGAYMPETFVRDDHERPVAAARAHWEELTGEPPLPDHDAIASFLIERRRGSVYAWNWGTSIDGSRELMRGNVVENAIRGRQSWDQTLLAELFAGVVGIGSQDRGWRYVLCPIEVALGSADRPPVILYDLLSHVVIGALATDIDHFSYLASGVAAFCDEKLSPEGLTEVWRRVSGHVQPLGQWGALFEELGPEGFEAWAPEPCLAETLSRRAEWIVALLGQKPLDEVARLLADDDTDPSDPMYHIDVASKHAPIGLYLLWRHFFFDEEESLIELIEATRQSPARILRDAATLVEELMYGREDLGKIEDIHEVREHFLDLTRRTV